MGNNVKPVEKVEFHATALHEVPRAPGQSVPAPVLVGRSPIPTATGIAHRLGWLAREAASDGTPLTIAGELLAAGELREGETVGVLWERSEGRETRLIGLTWVETYQAVVALPDAGIAAPEQLAGRRIGIPRDDAGPVDVRRAAARRGFHGAIGLAGLFPDEVVHVDVDAPARVSDPYRAELEALASGEVDAIFLAGAAGAAAAARIGAREVASLGRHLDPAVRAGATTPAAITVDAELLERRPEFVVRLLAVLLRAGAWAQLNAREATQMLADETSTAVRHVVASHGLGWPDQLPVDLSQRKLDALRAQHDFLVTHGFLARAVDLGAWADPQPLAAARELLAAERASWG
jgi:ABC-type nitrate/sulfonate/bicarbonate transport system substrate-binding protein